MSHKKISQLSSDELVAQFRSLVVELAEARDQVKPNSLSRRLSQKREEVLDELTVRGQDARLLLSSLFLDENPEVRVAAAAELQELMPEEAEKVLEEAITHRGFAATTARVVLRRMKGIDPFSGPPPLIP